MRDTVELLRDLQIAKQALRGIYERSSDPVTKIDALATLKALRCQWPQFKKTETGELTES